VCGLKRRWSHTQIDNPFAQPTNEYQAAEISVSSDEKPSLSPCESQQLRVRGSREAEFSGGHDIVSEVPKKSRGQRINVLIEQESHEAALR
jgi:hypothetical protein